MKDRKKSISNSLFVFAFILLNHFAFAQIDSVSVIIDSTFVRDGYLLKDARFFSISSSEVQQAELAIKRFVQDDRCGADNYQMKPLSKYFRTYVGLTLSDSSRVAYVAGRCQRLPGWRESIVLPKGGGSC